MAKNALLGEYFSTMGPSFLPSDRQTESVCENVTSPAIPRLHLNVDLEGFSSFSLYDDFSPFSFKKKRFDPSD